VALAQESFDRSGPSCRWMGRVVHESAKNFFWRFFLQKVFHRLGAKITATVVALVIRPWRGQTDAVV